jgi:hypothetical protein
MTDNLLRLIWHWPRWTMRMVANALNEHPYSMGTMWMSGFVSGAAIAGLIVAR